MRITVNSVEVSKVPGKKWNQIDVSYKNDKGELKGRKLMSFGVKQGLDVLTGAKEGDTLDITLEKDGQYWNWVKVDKADSSTAPAVKPAFSSGRDFESKEERAQRQVLIVRQSCIANAIATLKTEKSSPTATEVMRLATAYEQFVFGKLADAPQGAEAVTVE